MCSKPFSGLNNSWKMRFVKGIQLEEVKKKREIDCVPSFCEAYANSELELYLCVWMNKTGGGAG